MFFPLAKAKQVLILKETSPPQCRSFVGLSKNYNIVTHKEQMCVAICQFKWINICWIDFWELDLILRSNSNELDSSPESKSLNSWCESIVDNNSICIEGCSDNSGIEFSSTFFHGSNEIDHRGSFSEFEFIQHFSDWQVVFVDIENFNQFC